MSYLHAVIWLDHKRAQVIHFDNDSSKAVKVSHEGGERHLHHRRGTLGSGHAAEDPKYYEQIAVAAGENHNALRSAANKSTRVREPP